MIDYDAPLWRPPSEAQSLIFQVTLGCSFNRCSFCSMYRTKDFVVRPLQAVLEEIDRFRGYRIPSRKVFLADGDALVCDTDHLLRILERLHEVFPDLRRVSCYALPVNLLKKSEAELRRLREAGLGMIFYGIESGSRLLLRKITKGATPEVMSEGLAKARSAGLKVSGTVILGLGGRQLAEEHIEGTVELVNRTPPDFLSTLQLHVDPEVEAEFSHKFREPFEPQDDAAMLDELHHLVRDLAPPHRVIFRSNHASNALALAGTLPKDRDRLLVEIDAARQGQVALRPSWLRGH